MQADCFVVGKDASRESSIHAMPGKLSAIERGFHGTIDNGYGAPEAE